MDLPRACELSGWTRAGSLVSFEFDAPHSNDHSAVVCWGWMVPGQADLPDAPDPPPPPHPGGQSGAGCVAVPPGGRAWGTLGAPPPNALAARVRVVFGDADDTATLGVAADGEDLYSGTLDACGVAVWTFQVYS